jgi:hypothetical protein
MTNQGKRGGEGNDRGGDKSSKRRKFFAAVGPPVSRHDEVVPCKWRKPNSHNPHDKLFVFWSQNKAAALPLRSKGFLLTCVGGKEYQAAQDAFRILKEVQYALAAFSYGFVDPSFTTKRRMLNEVQ